MLCTCYIKHHGAYDVLILGVTVYGVSFVPISRHRAYSEIPTAAIGNLDGDSYICFDRVMFLSKNDFDKTFDHSYRKLSYYTFSKLSYTIHQYYMGDIVWSEYSNTFVYKEDYKEIDTNFRNKNEMIIEINGRIINGQKTVKESDLVPADLSKIDNSETDPFNFELMEEFDENIYDFIDPPEELDFDDRDMADIVRIAKDFKIPTKIRRDKNGENEEYVFRLVRVYTPRSSKSIKNASESRTKDPDKNNQYRRAWFTYSEVKIIARMDSSSVASEYGCSVHIAAGMIRVAKRILHMVVESHTVENNYTCYFNKGYTIEDVCNIYPNISPSVIESQHVQWILNGNSENNTSVREKWLKIIEENDIETMSKYVFLEINTFADIEGCSPSAADDILHKIFDRLSINPLLCAGFDTNVFDPEILANTILDIGNKHDRTIEEEITLERYNIVSRLNDAYRDSYNNHFNIKAGVEPIPSSVSPSDRDYFRSLIWNRFSRHQVMRRKRILTQNQKNAIVSGDVREVALYFMVPYKKAKNIIIEYKKKI